MELTRAKLLKLNPCTEGLDWYDTKKETDLAKICEMLLAARHHPWANWVLVRLMTKKQKVQYAVFAAEKVIDIFEKKYPNDKRPRGAIEAAKKYIKSPTVANKKAAAYAAANAAADDHKKLQAEVVNYGLNLIGGV